jgi:hypothetical protein
MKLESLHGSIGPKVRLQLTFGLVLATLAALVVVAPASANPGPAWL